MPYTRSRSLDLSGQGERNLEAIRMVDFYAVVFLGIFFRVIGGVLSQRGTFFWIDLAQKQMVL